jgi:hypothetical protein
MATDKLINWLLPVNYSHFTGLKTNYGKLAIFI